jgi:hypothetical protein
MTAPVTTRAATGSTWDVEGVDVLALEVTILDGRSF